MNRLGRAQVAQVELVVEREERARGVVAASTGNHGQGIAYGAQLVGASAIVCASCARARAAPRPNPPEIGLMMMAVDRRYLSASRRMVLSPTSTSSTTSAEIFATR